MRALPVLLEALTAALVITGCSGPGSVQLKPSAAPHRLAAAGRL